VLLDSQYKTMLGLNLRGKSDTKKKLKIVLSSQKYRKRQKRPKKLKMGTDMKSYTSII